MFQLHFPDVKWTRQGETNSASLLTGVTLQGTICSRAPGLIQLKSSCLLQSHRPTDPATAGDKLHYCAIPTQSLQEANGAL